MPRGAKPKRLEKSLAIWTAATVVLVIGVTMFAVHTTVSAVLRTGLAERGIAIAQSIGAVARPSLLAYNYAALQVAADGAVEDPALVYVLIHDKEGEVAGVASSHPAAVRVPRLPDLSGGTVTREVMLKGGPEAGRPVLEAVAPVYVDGVDEPWGVVRVGLAYGSLTSALRRMELGLAVSGLLLAALAVVGSRWLARQITAPLRRLAEGTEALSKGDTSHRIPVSGALELAEVAQAFNRMMDRVQEKVDESNAYQGQLAALNATLEQQVVDRTRAAEESEAQYRSLVDNSPDSILIIQGGRVRFVNRVFEETFSIREERALGPDFRLESLFRRESAQVVAERVRAWERGESPPPAEVAAIDNAGTLRQLELRGSRIEYRGNPAAECLLVDMTESKRLREKLEDSGRLRALGELAGGVAHDFNNLLGAILGRIQLLRARSFDSEVDAEMAVIEKAARDGRETVRRVQEFSRVRADRPFAPLLLSEILRDAVEITRTSWKSDAERRDVRIEVGLDCEVVPPILGNAAELREVFTNLILNAVDALPKGGRVDLRCSREGGVVVAEVADNGVGMSEEIRRHLFDPFFTTKGASGTGLGMSVAYGIVTRHDGSIEVASELGRGTRFRLEFPVSAAELPLQAPAEPQTPLEARPGRILVIDDEPAIAELIRDALVCEGHEVTIAASGEQGLELVADARFGLVMTDLGMPDMSGWEVAARIRTRFPELPVVLVTGWGTIISDEEIEQAGVCAVVHKPFEIQDLVAAAHAALQGAPVTARA